MPLRAVLFDLDGTLIDSMELALTSLLTAFEREGFSVTREALAPVMAHPFRVSVPMMVGELDPVRYERLGEAYQAAYRANEATMLREMPHAVALLDHLAEAGLPLGIVTNRRQVTADATLATFGWTERFGAVVGADVTPLPKPAADPALHALERLGVAPSEAAYVGIAPRMRCVPWLRAYRSSYSWVRSQGTRR